MVGQCNDGSLTVTAFKKQEGPINEHLKKIYEKVIEIEGIFDTHKVTSDDSTRVSVLNGYEDYMFDTRSKLASIEEASKILSYICFCCS